MDTSVIILITTKYKLTRRRKSISIDITVTALWLYCSSSSDFAYKCKKSKYIRLHIINSKHFCSFQYLFSKRSYDKKHISYQSYSHFTLVWRVMLNTNFQMKGNYQPTRMVKFQLILIQKSIIQHTIFLFYFF